VQPFQDPIQALQQYFNSPMPDIGFTGSSGLRPTDALGWSKLMNAQVERQNQARALAGQAPLNVNVRQSEPLAGVPNLGANPEWWKSTNANVSASPEGQNTRYGGMGLPPSLAGLYRAQASTYKPNPPVSMPNSGVQ
jgi:hypothetical protein